MLNWILILQIAIIAIIASSVTIVTFSACSHIYFTDRYHGEYTLDPRKTDKR